MNHEARRDHRDINQDLHVFATDPLAGAGLPLWLPDGAVIRAELQRLARDIARADGCQSVYSPVLGKRALFVRSGHWAKFSDDMFPVMPVGGDELVLRPANCPHHALIYAAAHAVRLSLVGESGEAADYPVAEQAAQPVVADHLSRPGQQPVGGGALAAAFAVHGEGDQVQRAAGAGLKAAATFRGESAAARDCVRVAWVLSREGGQLGDGLIEVVGDTLAEQSLEYLVSCGGEIANAVGVGFGACLDLLKELGRGC